MKRMTATGRYLLITAVAQIMALDGSHAFPTPPPGLHSGNAALPCPSLSPMLRIDHRHRHVFVVAPSCHSRLLLPTRGHIMLSKNKSKNQQYKKIIFASSSSDESLSSSSSSSSTNLTTKSLPKIDRILSQLTCLFPLFVLGSAILGSFAPNTLNWVNNGNWMSRMLAGVMLGTGMTLERSDFTNILASRTQRRSIPVGVLCQFILMPLSAFLIGRTMLLPYPDTGGKHLFLGLVLVGCCPGGTASNLVTLIAGADVALSVLLTTCSTVLASAVTPLLTKFIVGSAVPVSGKALCIACARVVLAPVAFGVMLNEYMPELCKWVSRWTPFASVLLVALICGGVVANTAMSMGSFPARLLFSVVLTHSLGFAAGYIVPKYALGFPEQTARTISIETGMQNSALAVVLAKSIGADPLSYLPGALSATAHSCLGSGLAAFWRVVDRRPREREEKG